MNINCLTLGISVLNSSLDQFFKALKHTTTTFGKDNKN